MKTNKIDVQSEKENTGKNLDVQSEKEDTGNKPDDQLEKENTNEKDGDSAETHINEQLLKEYEQFAQQIGDQSNSQIDNIDYQYIEIIPKNPYK